MKQRNYNRTGSLKFKEIGKLNELKNKMMQAELRAWLYICDPESSVDEQIKSSRLAHDKTQEFITYLRQVNDRYLSYPNGNIYANGLREYIINEMYSYEQGDDGLSSSVFHKAVSESGCRFLINALKEVDNRVRTAM